MDESMKPNFSSLDHKALALLTNDLWDQLQELRQERERLRLEILNLANAIRNRGCWECGERWELGRASTCKCKELVKKREWVGLTHEQTKDCLKAWDENDAYALCRAIEAKLKERNT